MTKLSELRRTTEITIASVLAGLVNRQFNYSNLEDHLVIEAIRRSSTKLTDASLEELGEKIGNMNGQSLKGFGNNVKGIYHELLYVEAENLDGDDFYAELFEATNHPGADVKILKDGEVIREIQLKSTDQPALVERHFDRYPDIPVAATSEVADEMDNVENSGFSDAGLEANVNATFSDLDENATISQAEVVAVSSGLLSVASQAKDILNGRKSLNDASGTALQDMGVAVTSSLLIDLIF
jgi:hypothetical protein